LIEKIFVTLGTHPQQFNRLLEEIDFLIEKKIIIGKVFCQTGYSDYSPKNFSSKKFLGLDEFEKKIKEGELIITHAGEGNIGLCKNLGKKMIVVPRRKEFGEHTNDHQLELAGVVEKKKLGLVAWQIQELGKNILKINEFKQTNIPRGKINELLEKFVGENFS